MLLGLTGAPGCGKSTALQLFSQLGWLTLDADAICHSLYGETESSFADALRAHWGAKAFTAQGCPDRAAIASIVFQEESERLWLNSLLHPEIQRRAMDEYRRAGKPFTVFDVPLLFESAWRDLFDKVVAIWCESSIQLARLRDRGWTDDMIERRLAAQLSASGKLEKADFGLINNSSQEALKAQCVKISNIIRNSNNN
jgi:dephospho-CoA kinase